MFADYVDYQPDFWAASDADLVFAELMAETSWQQPIIRLFGQQHRVPRLTAWFGDAGAEYQYSGIRHQPQPWTSLLRAIRQQVEQQTQQSYNSVLLNLYRDGQDSNGWHADDEPELCPNTAIASLSFGASRRFRMREKAQSSHTQHWELENGSLLLMKPGTQQLFDHCLPKTRRQVGARINLTFRRVNC
jgi:alkylated DNA repair dioxygenase AlkB